MASPFDPISAGDPYPRSAEARNAWNEMLHWWKTQRGGGPPLKQVMRQTGIIEIKNTSGYDRDRFDVLGIDDVFPDPTENLKRFKNMPALHGITPALASHRGKFAILLKPADDGKLVHAVVAGVTVAKVNITDVNHQYAEVKDGDATSLASSACGSALILWIESGTGVKWAVIRMGNDYSGASVPCECKTALVPGGSCDVYFRDWNGSAYVTDESSYETAYDVLGEYRGRARDDMTSPDDDGSFGEVRWRNQRWEFTELQPHATWIRCKINDSSYTGGATIPVDNVVVTKPVKTALLMAKVTLVQNIHDWDNANDNADLQASWNDGLWDAVQMDCYSAGGGGGSAPGPEDSPLDWMVPVSQPVQVPLQVPQSSIVSLPWIS